MPSGAVTARWLDKRTADFSAWLQHNSSEMGVSSIALYWRLVNLGLIEKSDLPYPSLRAARTRQETAPGLYNLGFVRRLQQVLERGHLTVMRAIRLLDCSIEELSALFHSYQLEVPFDL